jgi:LPXTG-motif cell wall-anchored protein
LWVDKDVDNKYMGLFGDVAWVFQAQAADPDDIWETPTPEPTITTEPTVTAEPTSTPKVDVTPTPPDTTPPVTGDKSLFYAAIVGIILSLGLIAAVLYRMKNDSDIKANAS